MERRTFLLHLAATVGAGPWALAAAHPAAAERRIAAAWRAAQRDQVGVLRARDGELAVVVALDVPTRAHGLLREADGNLLAVARRPGDWVLRWNARGEAITWRWAEPGRAFSGHVIGSADGRTLFTTEADLDSGAGLIGVRDAATLEKRAEWPTHGIDAHELIADASIPNSILVANGGVPTLPETGRAKRDLDRMDSSIVRLDTVTGALRGQWRLEDPRLSLRHLAWNQGTVGPVLGIALQAEHDDAAARDGAATFALFDGKRLRTVPAPRSLAGYGGDIAAAAGFFAVSCPRAQGVAFYAQSGAWQGFVALPEACPLLAVDAELWSGGRQAALAWDARTHGGGATHPSASLRVAPEQRLDNHWIVL